mmetsp:Transcript_22488/g.64667  ORF Transcript_22488/g.64667 Transcript_22488/m.64667 type:complete len:93 (+) Transcript_22488:520-798(+)
MCPRHCHQQLGLRNGRGRLPNSSGCYVGILNPETGNSKGYGCVHYEAAEAPNAAIEKLGGMLIGGQEVQAGKFMRRTERPDKEDWTNLYIKN